MKYEWLDKYLLDKANITLLRDGALRYIAGLD